MNDYVPKKSEVVSFCKGMNEMYEFGRSINPDLIIFPLRGAQPFSAAYAKISELNNVKNPEMLLLPIGTFLDIHMKKERGMTKPEKIEITEQNLDTYFCDNPKARQVLLVDEVLNGGTILTNFNLINNYLMTCFPDAKLNVCAIEHGQYEQRGKYKNQAKKHDFCKIRVDSLFVMDRPQYLPKVSKNGSFVVEVDDQKLEDIIRSLEIIC